MVTIPLTCDRETHNFEGFTQSPSTDEADVVVFITARPHSSPGVAGAYNLIVMDIRPHSVLKPTISLCTVSATRPV